jgi:branched-chain amino acid transport system permease protein
MVQTLQRNQALLVTVGVVGLLFGLVVANLEARVWVSIMLSGLTLGALYFLVAAGLSLIFGLMDVLNFAHGTIFMLGAYLGYTFFAQPDRFFAWLPIALALGSGLALMPLSGPALTSWRTRGRWASVLVLLAGAAIIWLAFFGSERLGLGQLPLAASLLLGASGAALFGGALSEVGPPRQPSTRERQRTLVLVVLMLGLALLVATAHESLAAWVTASNSNLRFLLAMLVGALGGGALGAAMEWGLIRPLYNRPLYQVLLTLGLVFVGDELVKGVWGPTGFPMERPGLFDGGCRAASIADWLTNHCASINILGRAFATYRLFIIVLGVILLVGVGVLLQRSRIGMIIRAGVQDRQMVEALGINVSAVFTGVFAFGAALAALGGVAAAPFIGVSPTMGLEYQLQAFIVVVLGGMGSYPGAALGAVLVGLARAFGDHFVLSGIGLPGMDPVQLSPAIARASTVLVMAVFLLARPAGIFGKKD